MKSFQQILFNYILSEMKRQEWKQATNDRGCAYLTSDGLRCAVGVCLPKSYDSKWLGQMGGLNTLIIQNGHILPKFISANSLFLSNMQAWHDNGFSNDTLREIASVFNLKIPKDLMHPGFGNESK